LGTPASARSNKTLRRQTKALKRLGCAVIYSDTASGKSMAGRPQLARALDDLDTGDELVIAEWDRATRSMWDGLQIIKAVIDAGAAINVLDRSYIDLTTPMGRCFMAMMSAMAEDERLRIIKRTHEGRQIARAKGVRMGRKPKLTPHQIKEARQSLAKGEPTRALAKSYGVSVSTISRLAA
jgi:DNA invertase Pin-like site-specific DNA recombinase